MRYSGAASVAKQEERKFTKLGKKKKFKLFDMNRDGKGVDPNEDKTPNLLYFFKLIKRNFSKLLSLNLIMLVQYIPVIIVIFMYLLADRTPSQTSLTYAALLGVNTAAQSPVSALLLAVNSIQLGMPVFNVPSVIVVIVLAIWFVVTFGWQNVGATYSLRSIVRGDPAFLISDYFYAIKKNFKQSFFVGLIDCAVIGVLIFDITYFSGMNGGFMTDVMFCILCGVAIIYFIMRFYIYLMVITFDLKISKIFKNALIFTPLGIKRNLLALLGIIAVDAIVFAMFILITAIGVILPMVYYFAFTAFMCTYAAYPVIKRYMIDPYTTENNSDTDTNEADATED